MKESDIIKRIYNRKSSLGDGVSEVILEYGPMGFSATARTEAYGTLFAQNVDDEAEKALLDLEREVIRYLS